MSSGSPPPYSPTAPASAMDTALEPPHASPHVQAAGITPGNELECMPPMSSPSSSHEGRKPSEDRDLTVAETLSRPQEATFNLSLLASHEVDVLSYMRADGSLGEFDLPLALGLETSNNLEEGTECIVGNQDTSATAEEARIVKKHRHTPASPSSPPAETASDDAIAVVLLTGVRFPTYIVPPTDRRFRDLSQLVQSLPTVPLAGNS